MKDLSPINFDEMYPLSQDIEICYYRLTVCLSLCYRTYSTMLQHLYQKVCALITYTVPVPHFNSVVVFCGSYGIIECYALCGVSGVTYFITLDEQFQ